MTLLPVRRFQRIYEQILLSQWFSLLAGWVLVVVIPSLLYFVCHLLCFFVLGIFSRLFLRLQASRLVLMLSWFVALIWFTIEHHIATRYKQCKLAIIKKGFAHELTKLNGLIHAQPLDSLQLGQTQYDGVVADFRAINPQEERFLTECVLQGVPVYNAKDVYESFTGRVKIDHMSENNIGALLPSRSVEF